jgi:hypothetical protein
LFENKDSWRVLSDDVAGSKLEDDADEIGPQPTLVRSSALVAEERRRLARNASRNDHWTAIRREKTGGVDVSDVTKVWDVRPVVSQDTVGIGVNLREGNGAESNRFKSEAETTNSRKGVKYGEVIHSPALSTIQRVDAWIVPGSVTSCRIWTLTPRRLAHEYIPLIFPAS